MKKLILSAFMLTGVVAFAQEPTQTQTVQDTTTAPKTRIENTTTEAPAETKKAEATIKEEKAEPKKASPAKKSK